jgi:hypothetical protein
MVAIGSASAAMFSAARRWTLTGCFRDVLNIPPQR